MAKRKGLGKGLDALFFDNNTDDGAITTLRVSEIEPNRGQPRRQFNDQALSELAASIKEHGVIAPLVVRLLESGGYQIVAGERRWRAARIAGLTELPVVIRALDDVQTLEIAIIENLQREDLNPIELAQGYEALMKDHDMTQEQVAARVGKSRSAVANTLRLLALPETVQNQVRDGQLSMGHARALLSLEDEAQQVDVARQIQRDGLPVRDVEKLVRGKRQAAEPARAVHPAEVPYDQDPAYARFTQEEKDRVEEQRRIWEQETQEQESGQPSPPQSGSAWGDPFYAEVRMALEEQLGRQVKIKPGAARSVLEFEFYDREDLMELVKRIIEI